MLQSLKNGLRKKVAIFLIVCIIFSTNSFNALNIVYADENELKLENQLEEPISEDILSEKGVSDTDENDSKNEESDLEEKEQEDILDAGVDENAIESLKRVSTDSLIEETKEIDENANYEEPEKDEDNLQIATKSEIEETIEEDEKVISTTSDTEYMELDAYHQFIYQDEDSVSYYDGTIILIKDLKLKNAIYFKKGATLDLAGHSIIGPDDNYALYVEDNFTLINSGNVEGKIEGDNNKFPTIYIKNATAEFAGGIVYGTGGKDIKDEEDKKDKNQGGDALHVYNSDIIVSGSLIYGGNGFKSYSDRGGDGGDALVVMESLTSNTIYVSEGGIIGGRGGDGYGDENPGLGTAIKVGKISYTGQYLGRGLKGNVGGGKGGTAINIKTDKFKSNNLTYERYTISAGDSGYSVSISKNEAMIEDHILFASGKHNEEEENIKTTNNDLFGAGWDDSYYSLHDLNGKNYLTSLKHQNPTGLCTAFAMTAYAETNLIKKYPDYVKKVLNKNIDDTLDISKWHSTTTVNERSTDNNDELNLSEMQFGMQLFSQPKDEFGNAGLSRHIYKKSNGNLDPDWEDYGSSSLGLSLTSTTWRSFVEEDDEIYWPEWGDNAIDWKGGASETVIGYAPGDANYMSILNNRTNKTVVHAKEVLVHDLEDFYNGSTFKRDEFIEQAKRDIIKYNGIEFFIYTCGKQVQATFPDGSHRYIKNGVDYGNVTSLDATASYEGDLGGHAIYCIGWDDDVEFEGAYGNYTGAFICKNSWHQFTLIPYDNAWGISNGGSIWYMDYLVADFEPSFSEHENIYFYDTGTDATYYSMDPNDIVFNVFKINNEKEKIKALSFFAFDERRYDISLYKISSLDDVSTLQSDLNNAANKIYTTSVDALKGYNTVKISDDSLNCNKGDMYAVVLEGKSLNVMADSIREDSEEKYETVIKNRSFYATKDDNGSVMSVEGFSDANMRIRLITNNRLKLNAISDSGEGSYESESSIWIDPILRASLSYIPEPTPAVGKVFVNYNTKADGTGITYTTNSLYHLNIADDCLVLYARYKDSTNNKALTFDKNDTNATGSMQPWVRSTGTQVIVPTATFEKVGYRFDHWLLNDTTNKVSVGDSLTLDDNITLKAVWVPQNYHIDYELHGAKFIVVPVDDISYTDEIDVPLPESMLYAGHEFKGWYDNKNYTGNPVRKIKVDKNDPKDLTYHALWDIQKFTVGFNMHGHGTNIEDDIVDYGSAITEPITPTEIGYAFMGWYTDATYTSLWDFNTLVYDDMILHASWSEAVNVVFDTSHGRAPATQYIVDGDMVIDPGAITVIGYDFVHWYEDDEEIPFDFLTIINKIDGATRTLHAKWNVKTYTVVLDPRGGTINSGDITSYTYGIGANLPTSVTAPSSNQYFAGWYENSSFRGNIVKMIGATDYGDKVYYAKYERQSTGGETYSRGGGSTNGGGSVTGRAMHTLDKGLKFGSPENTIKDITFNVSLKTIPVTLDTLGSTWETDVNGNTHLVIKNSSGVEVDAKNVFACIITKTIDQNGRAIDVQDFYYIDSSGNVYTGWLRDTNNLTYYFIEELGYNYGKLARGWTKINGDYYYFDGTGNLQKNIITPDGFVVDGNGKWVENAWQNIFFNINAQNGLTDAANSITSSGIVTNDAGASVSGSADGNISKSTTDSGFDTNGRRQTGKKISK